MQQNYQGHAQVPTDLIRDKAKPRRQHILPPIRCVPVHAKYLSAKNGLIETEGNRAKNIQKHEEAATKSRQAHRSCLEWRNALNSSTCAYAGKTSQPPSLAPPDCHHNGSTSTPDRQLLLCLPNISTGEIDCLSLAAKKDLSPHTTSARLSNQKRNAQQESRT